MIERALLLVALLATSPVDVIPCWAVRKAVAQYGEAAVASWARTKGIPEKDIERAKRCLK